MKSLQKRYEAICNEYVKLFCEKQELDFSHWSAGLVGDIVCFDDYYCINFSDIRLNIDTEQPKGLVLEWYEETTSTGNMFSYFSYTIGLRAKDLCSKNHETQGK